MWRDGALLVVRKGESFPARCIKSNRSAGRRRVEQAVEQGSALAFFAHLLNPIFGFLVDAAVSSSVTFTVGLSGEWHRKRRRAFWIAGAVIVASLAAAAYGVTLIQRGSMTGAWVMFLSMLVTAGGLLYGLNASTLVTAKRITKRFFWLRGVHPEFLAELPDWPGEVSADRLGHENP